MKGEIFNLFESFISETWDEDTYDKLYEEIEPELVTKDPFVGPGTYPDSDLMALVGGAVQKFEISMRDAVRAFGKFAFPKLAEKNPQYTSPHTHPKPFLLTLEAVIHTEVKKLYKDARPPLFDFVDSAPDQLTMIYKSERKLYDLVEGFLDGVSEYFDVPIEYSRRIGEEDGQEICYFDLTFGK